MNYSSTILTSILLFGTVNSYTPVKPTPKPECPKATDFCLIGDIGHRPSDINVPPCWIKPISSGPWTCVGRQYGSCDGSKGQVDISTCDIPKPQPKCPKSTDFCMVDGVGQIPSPNNAYPCWSKFLSNQWNCFKKVNKACDASKGQVDISTCDIPNPQPKCPKANDTCRFGYKNYKANDPNAPACWTKNGYGWSCTNKLTTCNSNQVDVSNCFKPISKCPGNNDICYDSYGKKYTLKGYGTPRCWLKSAYGWSCRNTYGSCNANEVDIKTC